jgi:hypothetical protein
MLSSLHHLGFFHNVNPNFTFFSQYVINYKKVAMRGAYIQLALLIKEKGIAIIVCVIKYKDYQLTKLDGVCFRPL